ncbi:helix-turn-helix domain-containing protein [Sphingomonas carotinifaciens]|uniref:helix-turn-helix transcriptional regulator n=1 Tax=Sphingomonas carotinifaciens TaxID=1166323 RepID=UPI000DDBDE5F
MNFNEVDIMPLMTTAEAAACLTVSPKTLAYWRATGDGPVFVRVGARGIRYRRPDLASYVQQRQFRNNFNHQQAQQG